MDEQILELTTELMKVRKQLDDASEVKKKLGIKEKELEYKLYYAMENNNINSFKHDEHGTIYRSHRVWCKVSNFDLACKFLKEKGVYDEVMKLEPRAGRLNALIKTEFLDTKGVIPETEIGISATLTPMIGNRAGKKGGDVVLEMSSETIVENRNSQEIPF
jgi:hypothetical protein